MDMAREKPAWAHVSVSTHAHAHVGARVVTTSPLPSPSPHHYRLPSMYARQYDDEVAPPSPTWHYHLILPVVTRVRYAMEGQLSAHSSSPDAGSCGRDGSSI